MNLFKRLDDGFAALRMRDQYVAIAAVAAVLGLGMNLLMIKPQLLKIDSLRVQEVEHRKALAGLKDQLDIIRNEAAQGIDPFAQLRIQLEDLRKKIRAVDAIFPQGQVGGETNIGPLLRAMVQSNAELALVSLRTLPSAVFYAPPAVSKGAQAVSSVSGEIQKTLEKTGMAKKELPKAEVVLANKTIYKHGVEVTVRGTYPALMAYMGEMERFPNRIFWSGATLDAKDYRAATLRLLVYTISDQPNPPLN